MESSNKTSVNNFILLGLSEVPHLQAICFLLFLLIYTITLLGNFLIITVVVFTKLCNPMYFFLSNLSCVDICLSSTVVPRLLVSSLSHDTSITFLGCAAQVYFLAALGATECMILAIMAYDRYTAICHPLHYNTIMNITFCMYLTLASWVVSFLNSVIHAFLTFKLPFCRSNHIDHFFCEMPPLFHLSCKETLFNEILMYTAAGLMALSSFILTFISYIHIISSILKIKSTRRREKTFYTCASHLMVVMLFYGNILIVYMNPHSTFFPKRDRAVSIFYTAITPMLNPIIYSIRNKVFLGALQKLVNKNIFFSRILKITIT